MQQTIVRTRSAAAFLALVPSLTGMQPRDSLVLVAFGGKRTRGAMRFDLPGTDDPKILGRSATTYTGLVCKIEGADGVVPVVYTDRSFAGEGGLPHRILLDRIVVRARRAGLDVKDALCVAFDGYGSLFDRDLPPEGLPLADLTQQHDLPPLLDATAATVLPEVDGAEQQALTAEVAALLGLPPGGLSHSRAQLREHWAVHLPRVRADPGYAEEAVRRPVETGRAEEEPLLRLLRDLGPDVVVEDALGFLDGPLNGMRGLAVLAALADKPNFRDLVLLQAGWGRAFGRHVTDRTLVVASPALQAGEAVHLAISGGDMARPDTGRVDRAILRIREAAARTPQPERAPLLTMLAWLHWSLGRGSIASDLAGAAGSASADYPFADLLRTMLGAGMLPEWAFRAVPLGPVGRRWMVPSGT